MLGKLLFMSSISIQNIKYAALNAYYNAIHTEFQL